jgi:hypothetical protein
MFKLIAADPPPELPESASTGGHDPSAPGSCKCKQSTNEPVNTATGDYYMNVTDLSIPTYGPPLSLDHSWGSWSPCLVP